MKETLPEQGLPNWTLTTRANCIQMAETMINAAMEKDE
jgi:hypothetical protein